MFAPEFFSLISLLYKMSGKELRTAFEPQNQHSFVAVLLWLYQE
jgi:hypothetical protein